MTGIVMSQPVPCRHPRANHQHGTYLAFLRDGCRCTPCIRAHRAHAKRTSHATVTGTHTYTDADPARAHVQVLLRSGLTVGQIEQRSGVHRTAIRVLIGDFPGRPMSKRITKTTHTALLIVRPVQVGSERSGLVDPTGTTRRIRALIAAGWTAKYLSQRLGMSSATIPRITFTHPEIPVLAATRAAVIDLYDELSLQVPLAGRGTTTAKRIAAGRGWVPPLAWDDDSLDDQDADVVDETPDGDDLDEVAIERRMAGDRTVALNRAERFALAARWQATGRPLNELERVTGLNAHRYLTDQRAEAS